MPRSSLFFAPRAGRGRAFPGAGRGAPLGAEPKPLVGKDLPVAGGAGAPRAARGSERADAAALGPEDHGSRPPTRTDDGGDPMTSRQIRSALLGLACAGVLAAQSTAPYTSVTNTRVDVPNLMPEPFTGMALDAGLLLWAVNPYGNKIVGFDSGGVRLEFATGWNPISLAVVEDEPSPGRRKLLVACAGTHGLFVHKLPNGRIESYVPLDAEPADVVYDEDSELAFVSCQGTNTVLKLDPLAVPVVVERYEIPIGERPGFLYLDRGGPGAADNRVYVAAGVTGNNSVFNRLSTDDAGVGSVFDLDGWSGGELDDWDVYCIDPNVSPGTMGDVTAVVRGSGSLQFDLDRHADGTLWILGTDSLNKDPALQSEPAIKGDFVINQLQRVAGVTGTSLVQAGLGIDLDDTVPGGAADYDACNSINQARALVFGGPSGSRAYVAGPFRDVILVLDAAGQRVVSPAVLEFQLPPGAQCYGLLSSGTNLLALCLGTMTVEIFSTLESPFNPLSIGSLSLGADPTPPEVKAGRAVFLDGSFSQDARSSCASCHVAARSDQLGWSLKGTPNDVKDVMVTQSLLGMADTFPHHWRGERDLMDFQKAFGGLLGARDNPPCEQEMSDAEMDDLVAFFQSLLAPANPFQNPRRVLDDSRGGGPMAGEDPPLVGDPIQGQTDFESVLLIQQLAAVTCVDCHISETGGDGNIFPENQGRVPRARAIEVAHFRQLQNKGRGGKWLLLPDDTTPPFSLKSVLVNENGFGFAHNGELASLLHFVEGFPDLSPQQAANITSFIDQFDQGLSPAAHWAAFYFQANAGIEAEIDQVLLAHAPQGWNDVAAIGRYRVGAALQPMRWWYDAASGLFEPETLNVMAIDWPTMKAKTAAGDAEHVFLGLPPGAGPRFAIDFDGDGLRNQDDPSPWTFSATSPGPPSLVDWSVDLSTARMAKLLLEFDEPVIYTVTYQARPRPGSSVPGPVHTASRDYFVQRDVITLTHSESSVPHLTKLDGTVVLPGYDVEFDASITFQDRSGSPVGPIALSAGGAPTFEPRPFFPSNPFGIEAILLHVEELVPTIALLTPTSVRYLFDVEVGANKGAPDFEPPGQPQMVFFTVATDINGDFAKVSLGTGPGQMTTPLPTSFLVDEGGVPSTYDAEPDEPWLVSPLTDAAGRASLDFTIHNAPSGTRVRVSAMGILPQKFPGPSPVFESAYTQWTPLLLEDQAVLELTIP